MEMLRGPLGGFTMGEGVWMGYDVKVRSRGGAGYARPCAFKHLLATLGGQRRVGVDDMSLRACGLEAAAWNWHVFVHVLQWFVGALATFKKHRCNNQRPSYTPQQPCLRRSTHRQRKTKEYRSAMRWLAVRPWQLLPIRLMYPRKASSL